LFVAATTLSLARDDGSQILTIDHLVGHRSTAPAIAGQRVQLYLRERVQAQLLTHAPDFSDKIVVFLHGAWLGGTGAFDAPYRDYSWMAYLAQQGFDTFSLDFTGYGYSTRPTPLDDPCNVAPDQRPLINPVGLHEPCTPSLATQIGTARSEWDDLDAAVDYLRSVRHVDRVSLVAWSLGGTRAAGYAALQPEKVSRLVLLAPSYDVDHPTMDPPESADATVPIALVSRAAVAGNWDRQVQCANQFDPAIRDSIWAEGLRADGVSWAPDQRRVPSPFSFRWNRSIAAAVQAPTLVISGELDQMSPFSTPAVIHAGYEDLGTSNKVFAAVPCASHFAMWETPHSTMFRASEEWLSQGSVSGQTEGEVWLQENAS
jgi:pimeloyl-ACP methyl ester carboxylesterase